MLNVYRFTGDMLHVISILLLILRLQLAKDDIPLPDRANMTRHLRVLKSNLHGISIKTQELYLLVFILRYLDLFTTFYSHYNSFMKIGYILTTAYIVYTVRRTKPFTENFHYHDICRHWRYIFTPCVALAILTFGYNQSYGRYVYFRFDSSFINIAWIFSIYLESVLIIPQLVVLQWYREVDILTSLYLTCLGLYRLFYILNWIWRSYYEPYYQQEFLAYFCGVIQLLLYIPFFALLIATKCRKVTSREVEHGIIAI
jgi:ER lumen protein retaining receptor